MSFAKKRFGQNFLHDESVIERIAQVINATSSDHLVEIGPGKAALTSAVLQAYQVDVIEIDRDLIAGLKKLTKQYPNLKIHNCDALTFDYHQLKTDNHLLRIIGNLPYNISTPLIFHLLEFKAIIQDMHFMLQKEVVDRICAEPGSKDYGRLSIMTQYHCQTIKLFDVPPTAFIPQPKVDSAIVRLIPYTTLPFVANNPETLQLIVTQAFSQRRKTLRNSVRGFISAEQLEELNIDPQLRPEQLSVAEYVKIANNC